MKVCSRRKYLLASLFIRLTQRCGVSISEESINDILAFYADQGDIAKTESFMSKVITGNVIPLH